MDGINVATEDWVRDNSLVNGGGVAVRTDLPARTADAITIVNDNGGYNFHVQVFNSASRELTVSSTATINSTPAGSGSPPAVDNTVALLGEDGTHTAYPGSNDFYFHVPAGTEFSDFFAEPPGVINSVSLTVGGLSLIHI